MTNEQTGFMCATDFAYHLPDDPQGAPIFGTYDALLVARPCIDECGYVVVMLTVKRMTATPAAGREDSNPLESGGIRPTTTTKG